MTEGQWNLLWSAQSPEQKSSIRQKAVWEGVTLMGVYRDWPDMFTVPTLPQPAPDQPKGEGPPWAGR